MTPARAALGLLLALPLLLTPLPLPAQTPSQADKELRQRLAAVLEENEALLASQERLAEELSQLDQEMAANLARSRDLAAQEDTLAARLPDLARQEKETAQALAPMRARYHRQLRALYLFGPEASLAFLASAADFHEALTRAQALAYLLLRQQRDFGEMKAQQARLGEIRALYALRQDEVEQVRDRIRQRQVELEQMRQARQGLLAEQKARQEAVQDSLDALGEAQARLARTFALWPEDDPAPEGVTLAKGLLSPPVDGRVLGRAGPGGRGVLIAARQGAQVRAPWAGKVAHLGEMPGFDQVVVLDHGERVHSVLARLGSLAVEQGQQVLAGEVLGSLDESATLYLEVRRGARPENPLDWLRLNP